jgi:hypothetical protein
MALKAYESISEGFSGLVVLSNFDVGNRELIE